MNYMTMLQTLLTSKKANVGGGAGAIIVGLPMVMEKLGIHGEPTTPQIILGILAVAYILIQGHVDHGKETERLNALRDFAASAIAKGVVPEKLVGMLKELDGVIKAVDVIPTAQPATVDVAMLKNLLSQIPQSSVGLGGDLSAKPAAGTAVVFPIPGTPGPTSA